VSYNLIEYKNKSIRDTHTLLAAEEVSKLIRGDLKSDEHAAILGEQDSSSMVDSYYYFLGHDYIKELKVYVHKQKPLIRYFRELNSIDNQNLKHKKIFYIVSCPYIARHRRTLMKKHVGQSLTKDYDLQQKSCSTCKNCRITRLKQSA
jgi:hypothetical protein